MSDEIQSEGGDKAIREALMATDWLLEDIVHLINHLDTGGFGFPITLYVNGQIVTGFLCTGKVYFNGLDETIQKYFTASWEGNRFGKDGIPKKNALSAIFTNKGKTIYNEIAGKKNEKDHNSIAYIHLKNAQIFSENIPFKRNGGGFWRGKISSVDGFIFGIMSTGLPQYESNTVLRATVPPTEK